MFGNNNRDRKYKAMLTQVEVNFLESVMQRHPFLSTRNDALSFVIHEYSKGRTEDEQPSTTTPTKQSKTSVTTSNSDTGKQSKKQPRTNFTAADDTIEPGTDIRTSGGLDAAVEFDKLFA